MKHKTFLPGIILFQGMLEVFVDYIYYSYAIHQELYIYSYIIYNSSHLQEEYVIQTMYDLLLLIAIY